MISCFPRPRSFNLALFLTTREDFFTMINIGIEFSQRKTWTRCSVSPRKNRLTTRFSNNTHRMKLCVLLNVCLKIKLRTFHPLPETIDIKTSSDLVFFAKMGKSWLKCWVVPYNWSLTCIHLSYLRFVFFFPELYQFISSLENLNNLLLFLTGKYRYLVVFYKISSDVFNFLLESSS